jgi:signal transduction histidine kinase
MRLRALAVGAAGTIALIVGVTTLAVVALDAARTGVGAVARSTERSTYLIGDLGRQLSRLRANVLEAATESGDVRQGPLGRTDAIRRRLSTVLEELPSRLPPPELEEWRAIEPRIEAYRNTLDEAMDALARGDDVGAEALLDEIDRDDRRVHDDVDALAALDHRATARVLDEADARMRRTMLAVALLGAALAGVLAAMWATIYRTLRRSREQLAEYVDRLEDSNRELDAFAGRIAHDMRNVFSPLPATAAILRQVGESGDGAGSQLAGRIERIATRAARLIDGLLTFSRAEHDDPAGATRLRPAIREVLEEHEPLQRGVHATIDTDVDEVSVALSPALLHLVLSNLVSNALKHLDGRPERRVVIRACERDQCCELRVDDTGPGIPAAAQARVFEPFYRVPGTRAEGVGLGLATVRRVVEAHGGRIALQSSEGVGTSVCVSLPAADDDGTPPTPV